MFNSIDLTGRKFREEAEEGGATAVGDADVGAAGEDGVNVKDQPTEQTQHAQKSADDNKPSDREAELLKESMARKAAIRERDETIKELKQQMKAWDGLDPDQVRSLLNSVKEAETRKLEEKGEYEAIRKQMAEAHKAEVQRLQDEMKALKEGLGSKESLIDELTVGNAFGQSRFIAEKLTLPVSKARALYASYFERNESGQIVGYDKPKGTSGRAPLVDAGGEPLSFDQAFAKIIDNDPDKDSLVKSAVKAGAGSTTDSRAQVKPPAPEIKSGSERIAAALASGKLQAATGLNIGK